MEQITVQEGQSVSDLAIQYYGSIEGADQIADLNDISPCAFIAPGTKLLIGTPVKKNTAAYFRSQKIHVATYRDVFRPEESTGEGIGYWVIGETFIVS